MSDQPKYDLRGIMVSEMEYAVMCDLFPDDPDLAEYLVSNDVTAHLKLRWQRTEDERFTQHGEVSFGFHWRLLDWDVQSVSLNGVHLRTEADVPTDLPLQKVVNAVFCSRVRQQLEAKGPKARRVE